MAQEVIDDDVSLNMFSLTHCPHSGSKTLNPLFEAVTIAPCVEATVQSISCTVLRVQTDVQGGTDRDTLGSSRSLHLDWCGGP